MAANFVEESLKTPVEGDFDVCVVGGSCTGVFAAVRAAQQGATVALVEAAGFFGGVATAGLVDIWHSLQDSVFQRQIIAGLTLETIERLRLRDAVILTPGSHSSYAVFNPPELCLELDRLVMEAKRIRPFLHCRFARPVLDGAGRATHIVIEDKSGRRALKAKCFVDASGDADLARRAGLPAWKGARLQPPTTGAVVGGFRELAEANPGFSQEAPLSPEFGGGFKHFFMWSSQYAGFPELNFMAMPRVNGADCSDADSLTFAEIEGRRQLRAYFDVVRANFKEGSKLRLAALASQIGVRETWHCKALHRLAEEEVLRGVRFPDAIANGSYRVDVHGGSGIVFKYLDGATQTQVASADGSRSEWVKGRWRPEGEDCATFYQIPYRSLVPEGSANILCAGRCVDADEGAYGAARVMVACNQTGEAAGLAAALAASKGISVADVDPAELRSKLAAAGALII